MWLDLVRIYFKEIKYEYFKVNFRVELVMIVKVKKIKGLLVLDLKKIGKIWVEVKLIVRWKVIEVILCFSWM